MNFQLNKLVNFMFHYMCFTNKRMASSIIKIICIIKLTKQESIDKNLVIPKIKEF